MSYLTESLNNFSLGFNLSLINSIVDIAPSELAQRQAIDPDASDTRQLQGQSPYVLNIDISYSNVASGTVAGIFFNSFGERLSKVSANVTPDVFEKPAPLLNFTASQRLFELLTLNLGVKNILNSEYQEVYRYNDKDYIFQSYKLGISYSVGLTYSL
jgi:outer membrane receptor protein involved in Fe transport